MILWDVTYFVTREMNFQVAGGWLLIIPGTATKCYLWIRKLQGIALYIIFFPCRIQDCNNMPCFIIKKGGWSDMVALTAALFITLSERGYGYF
jgi:hypothetical protein